MITAAGCRSRCDRLWAAVSDCCDAIVVATPEALAYLTGYAPGPFSFRLNEAAPMAVLRPGHATLIGDNLLEPFLREAFVDAIVAPLWYAGRTTASPRRLAQVEAVAETLRDSPSGRLGIDAGVPAALIARLRTSGPDLALTPIDPALTRLRRTKDPDELETLRTAIRAGEAGHAAGRAAAHTGATELDVFHAVERAGRDAIGGPVLVYGDFAAGARALAPDTHATSQPLRPGDLLVLDFSVVVRGYRGDFASTVCVGGRSTARQREVYGACREALRRGEALLRPGTSCREIDRAVRAVYRERGFDPDAPGHAGHGIGLGHPEAPFLVAGSDEVLAHGDVVTLEPSLFPHDLDGGVRIERNYHITQSGSVCLSEHELGLGGDDGP